MNTIRIDHLHLKCRGIDVATARAALRVLGPALARQLDNGANASCGLNRAGKESAAISVPAGVTPAKLAGAMAGRVTATIRAAQIDGSKF